jgi:hypothetical protein
VERAQVGLKLMGMHSDNPNKGGTTKALRFSSLLDEKRFFIVLEEYQNDVN